MAAKFPFSSLPGELRNEIYRLAAPEHRRELHLDSHRGGWRAIVIPDQESCPFWAFIRSCRMTYIEGQKFYWENVTVCLDLSEVSLSDDIGAVSRLVSIPWPLIQHVSLIADFDKSFARRLHPVVQALKGFEHMRSVEMILKFGAVQDAVFQAIASLPPLPRMEDISTTPAPLSDSIHATPAVLPHRTVLRSSSVPTVYNSTQLLPRLLSGALDAALEPYLERFDAVAAESWANIKFPGRIKIVASDYGLQPWTRTHVAHRERILREEEERRVQRLGSAAKWLK
ncbi:hypothetical protein ANO11243_051430 [Dothideomycetidae sp. 11243]|nr:hypothetical protein ANO11243_051430 [fungal sp. No.11243]